MRPNNDLNSSINSKNSVFTAKNDSLLKKLKQQEKMKELSASDQLRYKIEADGDTG